MEASQAVIAVAVGAGRMAQRQIFWRDNSQRSRRFAPAGQDVDDDVVAGDAGQQCFAHGRFHRLESVVEHRCQHAHEPPVGIIPGAELAPQS